MTEPKIKYGFALTPSQIEKIQPLIDRVKKDNEDNGKPMIIAQLHGCCDEIICEAAFMPEVQAIELAEIVNR